MSDDGKKAVWDFAKGYIKTFCNQVSFGGKVISGIGQYLHEGAEVAKNYLDDENSSSQIMTDAERYVEGAEVTKKYLNIENSNGKNRNNNGGDHIPGTYFFPNSEI